MSGSLEGWLEMWSETLSKLRDKEKFSILFTPDDEERIFCKLVTTDENKERHYFHGLTPISVDVVKFMNEKNLLDDLRNYVIKENELKIKSMVSKMTEVLDELDNCNKNNDV